MSIQRMVSEKNEFEKGNKMYQFHADSVKNRLYLTVKGDFDLDDKEPFLQAQKTAVRQLKPGLAGINNLLEVTNLGDGARNAMTPSMKIMLDAGVKYVIRILPESPSGELRSILFDKKSAAMGYIAKVVHSLEEAENLLDELEKQGL